MRHSLARVLALASLVPLAATAQAAGPAPHAVAPVAHAATPASHPPAADAHGKTARLAAPTAPRAPAPAAVHAGLGSLTGKTTVDPTLQAKMLRLLDESRAPGGAIVVSDVRTGRVLAWASRGPGDWVREAHTSSASVFKVVTTAALLDRHRVSLTTRQCYTDAEHGITEADLDDSPRDLGCVPFSEALGLSINTVFARLTLKHLSPLELRATAGALGFGAKVPADVDAAFGEATIPDDRLGLARASAGFWSATLSPLGALFAMQTIANGGEKVKLFVHDSGAPVARVSVGRAMSPETARAMTQMLVVTTRRGTAAKAFREARGGARPVLPNVNVAGKTGTLVGGHPTRMVSWFAGFAPAERPEIAVAVLLSNDVSWWSKGNVVARKVFEAYFAGR
ncbi:MAG: penicillin-binding protein [Myxococcales bacterium]|nr:penicillin-binding protein [Myxococcales bacterium]MBL0197506.1 penicillin-binding protein [Myxococcales bacterium]HQY60612.1 penicillin-binding transpeptidase domain-containing protein [Polyangiaceae bacterium]